MKKFSLGVAVALAALTAAGALAQTASAPMPPTQEVARWKQEASHITIVRDDWGIAHVHGATDAEAVFGMEYAQ
ncbi:MAG: hypothetical protein ACRD1E_05850, partial [Terriglobales bacterium]